jgi:hypothetical protein
MPFVDAVILGETKVEPHSWNVVQQNIVKLRSTPFTTLFLGGSDGQMTLEHVEDKGYYISAFGRGEIEEWLALDESLPEESVCVNISGHVDDVPRRVLVSEEVALDVAHEFYHDGRRSQKYRWIQSLELM